MGGARASLPLVETSLARGYFPRIDVAPAATEPRERLVARLARNDVALVVVGPLLSFESDAYADRFPRTRFVLIDGQVQGHSLPPNVVTLGFDRTTAFRTAGSAVAAALRVAGTAAAPPNAGSPAAAASSPPPSRIGVLMSADSDISGDEENAFLSAVRATLPDEAPVERLLPSPVDKAAVTAAVTQMRSLGVEVFLIGLGSLNPSALEALRGAGGSAVLGDWAASGGFAEQVLVSVECDYPGGIARAIDALGSGAKAARGSVRLVAGKARRPVLPRERRSRT